jgi:hypothetical protein
MSKEQLFKSLKKFTFPGGIWKYLSFIKRSHRHIPEWLNAYGRAKMSAFGNVCFELGNFTIPC